ncbi:hypothetical protein A3Q56_05526 [Intoshia linei]|uniref:Uncharacterized protein n=1 Tax=Intoshia linei TaxID=1819745 RepID=A0A177AXN7_9BILA|nr:hypothetical protein A3Q56_05526 [Intoshia linei]
MVRFIYLDASVLKTNLNEKIKFPNLNVAGLVRREFETKEKFINKSEMPMTALAATCTNLCTVSKMQTITSILDFLSTDTIWYIFI